MATYLLRNSNILEAQNVNNDGQKPSDVSLPGQVYSQEVKIVEKTDKQLEKSKNILSTKNK